MHYCLLVFPILIKYNRIQSRTTYCAIWGDVRDFKTMTLLTGKTPTVDKDKNKIITEIFSYNINGVIYILNTTKIVINDLETLSLQNIF